MNIIHLKTNRITNPMGFQLKRIMLSFIVEADPDVSLEELWISVSLSQNFEELLVRQTVALEDGIGYELDLQLSSETRYYWKVHARTSEGTVFFSEVAFFETGLLEGFAASFIGPSLAPEHPVLFRDFNCEGNICKARLYICGLGLYEASLNGNRIGNEYLTPYWNDYDAFLQYQTFDVTALLQRENKLEVMLGNGWYKGRFGLDQELDRYGNTFALIAQLHIEYADGHKDHIYTDLDWSSRKSQIVDSSIYDGEIVDASINCQDIFPVQLLNEDKSRLQERLSLPVVEKLRLTPKLIVSPKGEHILDFGQNMVGVVEFICREAKGKEVRLQHGEVLQQDCFYRDNLRTAKAEFVYISDGTECVVRPRFTFYGFRYVRVEGMENVCAEDFTGIVLYSDIEQTGWIETSNSDINQLFQNCLWGQRGNFVDVPMDCPQRDERLGWTADAQVFAATACFNMDCQPFYEKFMNDLRIDQHLYGGGIPNYSPSLRKEAMIAGSVWGDAATILPYTVYRFYGDRKLLAQQYPMIQDYVAYLLGIDEANGGRRLYQTGFHFGDWLAQDGVSPQSLKGGTDDYYIASLYYYYSVRLAAQSARILDKEQDTDKYLRLADEIRQAILDEYFSPNGRLTIDTQTGYVLSLYFNVYIDKQRIIDGLKARLKKDFYRIKCGFVGTPLICSVLCDHGMADDAYRLLFEEQCPSWLYAVKLGATTIWERWNSLLEDGTISGINMNSLNHYAYGSVIEFLYTRVAGLQAKEPAFRSVTMAPKPNYRLKRMAARYNSPSGAYKIKWSILEDGRLDIKVNVPYGCTATLVLPDFGSDFRIESGTNGGPLVDSMIELTAGDFDCSYLPKVDFNHPFSMHSVLLDLMKHPEAAAVIRSRMPVLYDFVNGENNEFLPATLLETSFLPMCQYEMGIVQLVNEELKMIQV